MYSIGYVSYTICDGHIQSRNDIFHARKLFPNANVILIVSNIQKRIHIIFNLKVRVPTRHANSRELEVIFWIQLIILDHLHR